MQDIYRQIEAQNVELAAISTDDVNDARQMASIVHAEYPVLADADKKTARAYKVFDMLGDGVAAPAVFIIDADHKIAWQQIGENISDRPTNEDILRELAALGY